MATLCEEGLDIGRINGRGEVAIGRDRSVAGARM